MPKCCYMCCWVNNCKLHSLTYSESRVSVHFYPLGPWLYRLLAVRYKQGGWDTMGTATAQKGFLDSDRTQRSQIHRGAIPNTLGQPCVTPVTWGISIWLLTTTFETATRISLFPPGVMCLTQALNECSIVVLLTVCPSTPRVDRAKHNTVDMVFD